MKKLIIIAALATTVMTASNTAAAGEVLGYYEGKPYTQVVQCTCKSVMLIGTTLYVVVPKQQQQTIIGNAGQYAKNRGSSAIEGTINHGINHAIWKLQQKIFGAIN